MSDRESLRGLPIFFSPTDNEKLVGGYDKIILFYMCMLIAYFCI